jgi:hypothetical protein
MKGPIVIFDFEKKSVTTLRPNPSTEKALIDAFAAQASVVKTASGTPQPE